MLYGKGNRSIRNLSTYHFLGTYYKEYLIRFVTFFYNVFLIWNKWWSNVWCYKCDLIKIQILSKPVSRNVCSSPSYWICNQYSDCSCCVPTSKINQWSFVAAKSINVFLLKEGFIRIINLEFLIWIKNFVNLQRT